MISDENPKVKFCLSVVASWQDMKADQCKLFTWAERWKCLNKHFLFLQIQFSYWWLSAAGKKAYSTCYLDQSYHWALAISKTKSIQVKRPKKQQKTLACIHTYTQFTNHIKSENRLLSWTLENKHTFPLHRVVDDCGLFSIYSQLWSSRYPILQHSCSPFP